MKLELKRDTFTDKSTIGKLYVNGFDYCETLEDVDRRLEEGGTKTPSKPTFRQITLDLKKLIGLVYATDELLQMAEKKVLQRFQNVSGFFSLLISICIQNLYIYFALDLI